ncbi:MAG: DUF3298 domain-containing protein [Acidobacteriota bacterium]
MSLLNPRPLLASSLLIGLAFGAACGAEGDSTLESRQDPSAAPTELHWKTETSEEQAGPCDGEEAACATVLFRFPVFEPHPSADTEALNHLALELVTGGFYGELAEGTPLPRSAEDLAPYRRAFLDPFLEFIAEYPDVPNDIWADERIIEVIYQQPKLVSLGASYYQYGGGAHPNSALTLVSVNPLDGRRWTLPDLLQDGGEEQLRQRAEAQFRDFRRLEPDVDLAMKGFYFEDGFALNDNFAVQEEGLRFYYSPYEIAPYALGPTDILLPWAEIRDLLRPDAPVPTAAPAAP